MIVVIKPQFFFDSTSIQHKEVSRQEKGGEKKIVYSVEENEGDKKEGSSTEKVS